MTIFESGSAAMDGDVHPPGLRRTESELVPSEKQGRQPILIRMVSRQMIRQTSCP